MRHVGVHQGCSRCDARTVVVIVGIILSLVACGGDSLEPSDIGELPGGTYVLYTPCAQNVSADVAESDTEIRVDDIRGDVLDGDCLGAVPLDLDAPIGERKVIVNGDTWMRIDANCELAVFAPEDAANYMAVPRPCPSS
jgi:hypothetical protein